MNRRRDDLRSLLLGGAQPSSTPASLEAAPETKAAPAPRVSDLSAAGDAPQRAASGEVQQRTASGDIAHRTASGAVRAMGLSLGQKAREAEENARALQTLRAQLEQGEQVVEIAPALIEPSFAADRLATQSEDAPEEPDFAAFVEDIRTHGQQVPILLRPHPEAAGRYQIAYGHRRWRAAQALGRSVKAQVRPLRDAELVVAQGQENAQRRDLSFIEKAFFARSLDERGFDRATLCAALAVQSAEISRLLVVARAVPAGLVTAIGPAPKAGRPRWLQLVELLARPSGNARMMDALASPEFRAAGSDERFALVFAALSARAPAPTTEPEVVLPDEKGRALARREVKGKTIRLVFDEALAPDFAALVADRLPALYAEWRAAGGAQPATRERSARSKGGNKER
ncbi:MAG: plasmid partitioning protein RepB [Proteobacteria bacterium]|nr:plasmid partitioning protein RepB [Pseudomonadota bacterium]